MLGKKTTLIEPNLKRKGKKKNACKKKKITKINIKITQ
jgi:hypothetical protein